MYDRAPFPLPRPPFPTFCGNAAVGNPQGVCCGLLVLRHAEPVAAREALEVLADVPAPGGPEPEGEAGRGAREDHHQDGGTAVVGE